MSSNITDQSSAAQGNETIDKGKGKAIQLQPTEETEGETSEDEEMDEDGEEEDELAEIDSSNIIQGGRRTRGKKIDFAAAAKEQPAADEDSEDDEDFVAPEDAEDKDVEMQ